MMRRLKYFMAGGLIGMGTLISLLCLLAVIWGGNFRQNSTRPPQDSVTSGVGVFLLLGAPPIVMGSTLWWLTAKRDHTRHEQRLQRVFFNLLEQNQGRMSVLDFAVAAKLNGEVAKAYLDHKALEFQADFDVNSEGAVLYNFNTSTPDIPSLQSAAPTYDVILQDYPSGKQATIIAEILRLGNLSESQAKAAVQGSAKRPTAIGNDVDQIMAENLRERLEELGATVLVILR